MPSRRLIKKIRPLLYSKYPPSSSKSGLITEVGHREGSHSELCFQNKSEIGIKPVVLAQRAQAELTTFPMSNFNYETRFRTTRGVLAIQKWSYFFDLTPGRYESGLLSKSGLLSFARSTKRPNRRFILGPFTKGTSNLKTK